MQGKNAMMRSSCVIFSNTDCPPPISVVYLGEQVNYMVSLSEVVLNIVILCFVSELLELVLECSALLKEAVNLSFDVHGYLTSPSPSMTPRSFLLASLSRFCCAMSSNLQSITWATPEVCHNTSPSSLRSSSICSSPR